MFKKALAAIALAGAIAVIGPQAATASETSLRGTTTTTTVDTSARDAAAKQALTDIEQRLAGDPLLVRQVQRAASIGDTDLAARLLSAEGAEVVGITSSGAQDEFNAVRIRVTVTVCVRVWGTVYCGTVTVTVDL